MAYKLIENLKPEDVLFKEENKIYLNSFIHYNFMEAPPDDNYVLDYSKINYAYLVMIKLMFEYGGEIKISLNTDNYYKALESKMIESKKAKPVWKIELNEFKAFGYSLPEAICKLAIAVKYGYK